MVAIATAGLPRRRLLDDVDLARSDEVERVRGRSLADDLVATDIDHATQRGRDGGGEAAGLLLDHVQSLEHQRRGVLADGLVRSEAPG